MSDPIGRRAGPAPAWARIASFLGAWAIAALVVTLRHQGASVLDSMWAEDGAVFLEQASERGPLTVVLEPYAGYLHVPARLVAAIATAVPLDAAAAVMSGSAIAIVAALAVFVFVATRGVVGSPLLRILVASAVVLTPVARIESLDSMANLHFSLLFAAFWALLGDLRGRGPVVVACLVVAGAALSDPLAILLVPVAAWRVLTADPPPARAPLAVGALSLAIQSAAIALGLAGSLGDRSPEAVSIALGYPLRVVGGLLLGLGWTAATWEAAGHVVTVGGSVVLAVLVAAIATWHGPRQWMAGITLLTSMLVYGTAMWLRWDAGFFPGGDGARFLLDGVRYLLVPVLLLLSAAAMVVDGARERIGPRAATTLTLTLVAIVGATTIVEFSAPDRRTRAPTWAAALADAREACRVGADRVAIPIAPRGWEVELSCVVVEP